MTVIRPAMPQRLEHRVDDRAVAGAEHAANAAHIGLRSQGSVASRPQHLRESVSGRPAHVTESGFVENVLRNGRPSGSTRYSATGWKSNRSWRFATLTY